VKSDAEKRNLKLETGNLKLGGEEFLTTKNTKNAKKIVVVPNGVEDVH